MGTPVSQIQATLVADDELLAAIDHYARINDRSRASALRYLLKYALENIAEQPIASPEPDDIGPEPESEMEPTSSKTEFEKKDEEIPDPVDMLDDLM